MDNETRESVIIVPLRRGVTVSDDKNVVTCEDKEKLKGYTLSGNGWKLESESVLVMDGWSWEAVWHCPFPLDATAEQAHILCYFMNKIDDCMVIKKEGDGRYRFMLPSKAEVAYSNAFPSMPAEIVFSGTAPYCITHFEGDVEVAGRAVEWADKCMDAALWQYPGVEF